MLDIFSLFCFAMICAPQVKKLLQIILLRKQQAVSYTAHYSTPSPLLPPTPPLVGKARAVHRTRDSFLAKNRFGARPPSVFDARFQQQVC